MYGYILRTVRESHGKWPDKYSQQSDKHSRISRASGRVSIASSQVSTTEQPGKPLGKLDRQLGIARQRAQPVTHIIVCKSGAIT